MNKKFEVDYLQEAADFLKNLDVKTRQKIDSNVFKAMYGLDSELFKKLTGEIWEFRTFYGKQKIRLLAFWDKRNANKTLVIATHGFVKKKSKVDAKEIAKAEQLRKQYFGLK